MVWAETKQWFKGICYDLFNMDNWKRKSDLAIGMLILTFFMALIALIAIVLAYVDIHVWSKQGEVVLIPQQHVVEINGRHYIPIKLVN